jgi:membrane fusion protein, multidrug efflux system
MNGRAPLPLRIVGRLIGLAIIVAGIAAAVMVARTSSGNPRTDDAYVSANVIGIAPHVQGPLVQLNVVDNQPVEANDLLFVIDPRPYEAELRRAQGELIVAQAEVSGIEQAIAAGRAEVARLQADMAYARTHAGRLEPLVGGRFISADQFQEAVSKARRSKPRLSTPNRSWRSNRSCWRSRGTSTADWRRPSRASGWPS